MTVADAEAALDAHDAFEPAGDGYAVTTTAFDATVRVAPGDDGTAYRITVRAPTIDAAVAGEAVADVVREGWFETFERRIGNVGGVTRVEPEPPTVERDGDAVVVRMAFGTDDPERGAEDAKALVEYVEGTYVQGVIPGYDYREPVAGLLDRARERSEGGAPR